jgi:hypothetical protein
MDYSFEVATTVTAAAVSRSLAKYFVGIVVAAGRHLPTQGETVSVHFL